jgi:hypothetical protein
VESKAPRMPRRHSATHIQRLCSATSPTTTSTTTTASPILTTPALLSSFHTLPLYPLCLLHLPPLDRVVHLRIEELRAVRRQPTNHFQPSRLEYRQANRRARQIRNGNVERRCGSQYLWLFNNHLNELLKRRHVDKRRDPLQQLSHAHRRRLIPRPILASSEPAQNGRIVVELVVQPRGRGSLRAPFTRASSAEASI